MTKSIGKDTKSDTVREMARSGNRKERHEAAHYLAEVFLSSGSFSSCCFVFSSDRKIKKRVREQIETNDKVMISS